MEKETTHDEREKQLWPYEAVINIAEGCTPSDIEMSGNFDLKIHPTATTIWPPISDGRFLEYVMDEALAVLGNSRPQLVVLGVVSYNDYSRDISGLGCATNFKIINDLPKATRSPMGSGSEAKQEVSGLEGVPKADQKAELGRQSTSLEKDTIAQDLRASAIDEEPESKM
ncbi:MAG: hypothetical protein J3R72DRAFT_421077 [Linnemannia gamsii]|nr:MAG: hypothetical protein J3R72DRAFT_421077 [Linnemannia gamsii]